jgi:hypothetical protein
MFDAFFSGIMQAIMTSQASFEYSSLGFWLEKMLNKCWYWVESVNKCTRYTIY